MATMRDLTVRIRANADEFDAAMKSSGLSARGFSAELRNLEQQEARRAQAMRTAGRAMTVFGAAVLGGLGLAAKAAIDWESAWTGVVKVIDGSPAQLARVEEGLRGLARELPISHREIAGVAQAAGQLGISTDGIVSFTRTMVNLGQATNLSAEEAAFAIARMANVMGTSEQDVDRLGSSLVLLGNNSATTESEILQMAQRIAGAGNQIGLTEGEVLGFAAALSSVGIEAQAGGSSISRAMITISAAVNDGGDALDEFARVSGMSADEFATAFRERPAEAISTFVTGLGRISDSGGDVFSVLDSLGLSEVRVRDAFLRLAGNSDLLAQSLMLGNQGWSENTALLEEAARVYATTESKMAIARGQMQDFAITVGQTFTPIIGAAADKVSNWAQMIGELPEPAIQAGAALGGIVGAASLVGGGMLLLLPRITETMRILDGMGGVAAATAGRLRGLATFLTGPYGIALGAAAVATALFFDRKADQAALTRDLTQAIQDEGDALNATSREIVVAKLAQDGLLQVAKDLGIGLADLVDAHLDPTSDAYGRVDRRLRELNRSTVDASDATAGYGASADLTGPQVRGLRDSIMGTNDATAQAVQEARLAEEANRDSGEAAGDLSEIQGDLAGAMEETASAADDLKDALEELAGGQRDLTQAQIRYLDDVQKLTEALADNGSTFDLNTDAGRRNLDALIRVADSSEALQVATIETTGSVDEATAAGEAHRKKLVDIVAQSTGNRTEAERLVDSFLGTAGATDIAATATENAEDRAARYKNELGRLREMSSGGLRPEIDRLIGDFDTLGGAHASAKEQNSAQVQELLGLARRASPELRAEILRLAREIAAIPDGEFDITANGKVNYPVNLERARQGFGLATGGIVPGYTPGRDVHRFTSETGGALDLSGGEAVMRPEFTRAVGTHWVDHANAAARSGGMSGVQGFLEGNMRNDPTQRLAMGGVVRGGIKPFPKIARRAYAELGDAAVTGLTATLTPILKEVEEQFLAAMSGGWSGGGPQWRQLFAMVKKRFPAARMTSGLRPGDPGHHGRGTAVDIAGPSPAPSGSAFMASVNRWIHDAHGRRSAELIYDGIGNDRSNIKNGRAFPYSPGVRAAHRNHVHWAMGGGPAPAGGSGGGGPGVARWRGMVLQSLGIMGLPASLAATTLRRMNQESGGNPRAVNNWDSNARRGTPSVGLMQVIGPTYRANRHPRFDRGPYIHGTSVDPLANTLAAHRYTLRRYGSLPAGYNRRGGYDDGGLAAGRGFMRKDEIDPERVLSPRQTVAFEQLVRVLDSPRFTGPAAGAATHKHYHLTVHNAEGQRVDLETQFRRLELRAGV